MINGIDASEFLDVVRPALEVCDAARLAQVVRVRWRPSQVCQLMRHEERDVRRVAAVTLGLIGDLSCTPSLTRALRDEDEQVNQMAEYGLWSVWFRSGRPDAVPAFREGLALLSTEAYEQATERFQQATRFDPQFAEAYNQCAIAHYFLAQWEKSVEDCARTIRLISTHFGAIVGKGHGYAQMGDMNRALQYYRQALRINPRMDAIARAIRGLEANLEGLDTSGEFIIDVDVDQSQN